ncbi:acylphosphatase [Streptomyces xantholiticus]|nr:acylphosphatase [Streptomyces xantholiticus]
MKLIASGLYAMRPGGEVMQKQSAGYRAAMNDTARLTAWVRGRVQGVGFRWFTRANALEIGGLTGFALNLDDGRVQVVAEGSRENCHRLLEWLRSADTPGHVDGVTEIWDTPRGGYPDFAIR